MGLKEHFGKLANGTDVDRFYLDNGVLRCAVLTYGGAIQSLEVPDRQGRPVDVVLGFDTIREYQRQDKYIGALIGRYANRIAGSCFTLNGEEYELFSNDGNNHLHGGKEGFDRKVWDAEMEGRALRLDYISRHMEEGYPGNLSVRVTYSLEDNGLVIHYRATSDMDTICNLTNHSYFNLDGHASGSILRHTLKLYASAYTPVADRQCIPTGDIAGVEGTPMDFRENTSIGERIDNPFEQLRFGAGYDHNWLVEGDIDTLRPAAEAYCEDTGIKLTVTTTSPGIQFYSGNYLDGLQKGKQGAVYGKRSALCLETQFFPNAPNTQTFLQPILKQGALWEHTTVYRFDAQA
jgi:aldose 1-epimerase